MKKLNIKINCTNVYFGGNRSGNFNIRESNIIGFIRKWYEALGKETGYFKHNKNNQEKCEISFKGLSSEQEIIQKASQELCLSCFLFGTTGWAKRFWLSLTINNKNIKKFFDKTKNKKGEIITIRTERFNGDFDFSLVYPDILKDNHYFKISLEFLWFTLKFIEKYGYFGARNGRMYNKKGIIISQEINFKTSKFNGAESKKTLKELLNNLETKYKLKLRNKNNNKSNKLIDWVR